VYLYLLGMRRQGSPCPFGLRPQLTLDLAEIEAPSRARERPDFAGKGKHSKAQQIDILHEHADKLCLQACSQVGRSLQGCHAVRRGI
jgi:hypothetical protein